MGILDKLLGFFKGPAGGGDADPHGLWFHFRCDKCGAVVRIRVDRRNDLNAEDGPGAYVLRKEVMDNECFSLMRAEIWLDSNLGIASADVTGGSLISREEFEAAQPE